MFTRAWLWIGSRACKVTVTNPTDSELVAATLEGDRDAFGVIVERHGRHVYQLCYRFAGNHQDASDLSQDVFIRAFRALRTFKGNSALSTWLYRIAVNVSLNKVSANAAHLERLEALARAHDVAA